MKFQNLTTSVRSARLRQVSAAALCSAVVLTAASAAMAADSLTIASAGGTYQDALREAAWKPIAEEMGITINEDTNGTGQVTDVRVQVKSGSVQWNIAEMNIDQCAIGAKEGLFEELDYNLIDKSGFAPGMAEPTYIAQNFYSYVIGWNKETFGEDGPKTWADFWNVEKFPGRRSLWNYPTQTMEAAVMADGVKPSEVYPLDIARAMASLEKIKPHINVWWTTGAQSAQLLQDNEIDMIGIWNGRITALQKEGGAAGFTFNEGIAVADCLVIPKGQSPEMKELAMKVLAKIVSADIMANLPQYIDYGPANAKAYDTGKISPELLATLNTAPENFENQAVLDGVWWSEHATEAQDAWNAFMVQ